MLGCMDTCAMTILTAVNLHMFMVGLLIDAVWKPSCLSCRYSFFVAGLAQTWHWGFHSCNGLSADGDHKKWGGPYEVGLNQYHFTLNELLACGIISASETKCLFC